METAYVTRDPIVDEGAELERAPEKPEIALDSDETEPETLGILCPHCGSSLHGEGRVIRETRRLSGGKVARLRSCKSCNRDSWTTESIR